MRLIAILTASMVWLGGSGFAVAQSEDETTPSSPSESAPAGEKPATPEEPRQEDKSADPSASEEKNGSKQKSKQSTKKRGWHEEHPHFGAGEGAYFKL